MLGGSTVPIRPTRAARIATEAGSELGAMAWLRCGGLWLERKMKSGGQRAALVGAWHFAFMRRRRRERAIRQVLEARHVRAPLAQDAEGLGDGEEGKASPVRRKLGWVDRYDTPATAAAAAAELKAQRAARKAEKAEGKAASKDVIDVDPVDEDD